MKSENEMASNKSAQRSSSKLSEFKPILVFIKGQVNELIYFGLDTLVILKAELCTFNFSI